MKISHNILACLAIVVTLAFSTFVPVLATPALAAFGSAAFSVCDPSVPGTEGYRNKGGFCDAVAKYKSLDPWGGTPFSCPDGEHGEHPEVPGPRICVPDEEPA